MQSALLTNFKVLLALLFRDIVHQISKLIFYVTHISASFPTHNSKKEKRWCDQHILLLHKLQGAG